MPILSYGGTGQDISTTVEVTESSLTISGNGWKKIAFPYTVTPDTILEFDFESGAKGEIHGIGFDTDNVISADRSFTFYGTQNWGIRAGSYRGNGQEHFVIRVGGENGIIGAMQWLTFINDHDVANPTAESRFSNIRVYEAGSEPVSGGTQVAYLHTDHLGSVVKAIIWVVWRKPFGSRVITAEQVTIPLGFPGQYYDEETNNYYNYFRDYDPGTGRYLQSDPIGLGGGLNTYAYVGGNPLYWIDPLGLASRS